MKKLVLLAGLCFVNPGYAQSPLNESAAIQQSQSNQDATGDRAQEIHNFIVAELQSKHEPSLGQTWFDSTLQLNQDWIVQSPNHLEYLSDSNFMPKALDCKAGSAGCDPQFLRKICSVDADCQASNVSCKELAASVAKPWDLPKKMCQGPADQLMDRVYKIMVSAQDHLEVTSLSSPNGRFREAVINALTFLSLQDKVPTVRFLYSGDSSTSINFISPPDRVLKKIAADVAARGGKAERLRMNLAWLSTPQLSWNHSKIIIADQERMLTGGHNLWDADYLGEFPVFDLSMEVSGAISQETQKFVNTLWSKVGRGFASYPAAKDRLTISPRENQSEGARVIGVGRLGALGNNAADDAMIAMLNASRTSIYLSQQDLYSALSLKVAPSWALPALVDAILRGVKVNIIQSNPGPFLGYGMVSPEKTFKAIGEELSRVAQKRQFLPPSGLSLQQYFCEQVTFTPYRFDQGQSTWSNGSSISNHAKMIIVDETSFYIGSQNFYPANLQEYGLIVNDKQATQELLEQYWMPLWSASQVERLSCP